jgi:hypothetical protein
METMQRRSPDTRDISEDKREEIEVEEYVVEDSVEDHLLKFVSRIRSREKIEVPMYEGNLEVE